MSSRYDASKQCLLKKTVLEYVQANNLNRFSANTIARALNITSNGTLNRSLMDLVKDNRLTKSKNAHGLYVVKPQATDPAQQEADNKYVAEANEA